MENEIVHRTITTLKNHQSAVCKKYEGSSQNLIKVSQQTVNRQIKHMTIKIKSTCITVQRLESQMFKVSLLNIHVPTHVHAGKMQNKILNGSLNEIYTIKG